MFARALLILALWVGFGPSQAFDTACVLSDTADGMECGGLLGGEDTDSEDAPAVGIAPRTAPLVSATLAFTASADSNGFQPSFSYQAQAPPLS